MCVDVDNGVEHESDDNVSDVDDALCVENVQPPSVLPSNAVTIDRC